MKIISNHLLCKISGGESNEAVAAVPVVTMPADIKTMIHNIPNTGYQGPFLDEEGECNIIVIATVIYMDKPSFTIQG